MDADRNLLFGVLALQADLIDARQFVEACSLWATRKESSLAAILLERRWLEPADVEHVHYLVAKKLRKHGGDARASLTSVNDDIKRSLAALADADVQQSLTDLSLPAGASLSPPQAGGPGLATVDPYAGGHNRYRLTRLHATGGIGRVWVARDAELGRDVALKELRPERSEHADHWKRFLQEARITGQLEHPGIVPVYELARQPDSQQPFYTMRFVKGTTLSEAARAYHRQRRDDRAQPLDFIRLLNAFVAVANTIAYAHSRGVLHRDLKGQNVVLGDFGEVVVLDWGLAKLVDRREADEAGPFTDHGVDHNEGGESSSSLDLTMHGQAVGTPAYMAPEQASGRLDEITTKTDVYGLGAILYEILTGTPPFPGENSTEILRRVRDEPPPRPSLFWPEVPAGLESLCLRALAKDPAQRPASATVFAQEVQSWQEQQRKEAEEERDRYFAVALDLLCVAGFDGYFKRLNPAWERSLGYTLQELQGKPFIDFIHPEDRAKTLAEVSRLSGGGETIFFENRYLARDGTYHWLSWTATPYFKSQPPVIYAAARDITASKRAEEALRASEERYRSVVAAMHAGIILWDAKGHYKGSNAAAEHILGLTTDQLRGRTSTDPRWQTIHEDGRTFSPEEYPVAVTLRTGRPCRDVIMGVRKPDGAVTWVSVNAQPLFEADGHTLAGVASYFEDISRRS